MTETLRALDRHPEVAVSIRHGTEHFDDGVITLTVRGDGTATVEQLRSGQTTRHQQHLDPARVAAIGAALAEHRFTAPRTTTLPREPGDTRLILTVEGGPARFATEVWYADRYGDPDLDAIVRLSDGLVHEVSGGALGSPARTP